MWIKSEKLLKETEDIDKNCHIRKRMIFILAAFQGKENTKIFQ